MLKKILIIDDDVDFAFLLKRLLKRNDYQAHEEYTASKALQNLENNQYDLIISDVKLPDGSGMQLLPKIKKLHYKTPVILITGYSDIKLAVDAIKLGASDFITKPLQHEELLIKIKELTSTEQPVSNKKPKKDTREFIEGSSAASKNITQQIDLVAGTNFSVLILGESGSGKEYVAKRIHDKSKRKGQPFIAIDCGALPNEIAGSELFGHMKGAFTGAVANKKGHFEEANGGTIFLDEIGNLSYENQIKLLRVIQERKIKRLGSSNDIDIDVRIIAATNEDVFNAMKEGKFREDLYFRLNEFKIELLPLRERREDIMDFANFFLEQANVELEKSVEGFSDETTSILKKYNWPGNLRELKNIVRRSALLCQETSIPKQVIPLEIQNHFIHASEEHTATTNDLKEASIVAEKKAIIDALRETKYNKSKAAKLLNIDRKTLYNKLHSYDIKFDE